MTTISAPPSYSPIAAANQAMPTHASPSEPPSQRGDEEHPAHPAHQPARKAPDGHELTPQELKQIEELRRRDREVRQHEQAHIAAGGRYVRGGASFEYQEGPDGKRYAVGGEVSIDTSEEPDPAATIRKMETVKKAALAPAQPSAQDRAVAAKAQAKEAQARAELQRQQMEGQRSRQDQGASAPYPATQGPLPTGTIIDIVG